MKALARHMALDRHKIQWEMGGPYE
jgi:hypothetical protein